VPLLLYCVAEPQAGLQLELKGVAGLEVRSAQLAGVTVFFSDNKSADLWLQSRLRDSATQFNLVLNNLFRQFAIVPFRFPTLVENAAALAHDIDMRAGEFSSCLQRFRGKAQMDVKVIASPAPARNPSGAEYLQVRQQRQQQLDGFAAEMQAACRSIVEQWRRRPIVNGLRLSALLNRGSVEDFRKALARLVLPPNLAARVSGPWPVAEFLEAANGD